MARGPRQEIKKRADSTPRIWSRGSGESGEATCSLHTYMVHHQHSIGALSGRWGSQTPDRCIVSTASRPSGGLYCHASLSLSSRAQCHIAPKARTYAPGAWFQQRTGRIQLPKKLCSCSTRVIPARELYWVARGSCTSMSCRLPQCLGSVAAAHDTTTRGCTSWFCSNHRAWRSRAANDCFTTTCDPPLSGGLLPHRIYRNTDCNTHAVARAVKTALISHRRLEGQRYKAGTLLKGW